MTTTESTTTQTAGGRRVVAVPITAYLPIAAAFTVVALVGEMRDGAAAVVAATIAVLITATLPPRPISTRAAGTASVIVAAGIGALEAIATGGLWPLMDAGLFAFVAGVALALLVDEQPNQPTDPGADVRRRHEAS